MGDDDGDDDDDDVCVCIDLLFDSYVSKFDLALHAGGWRLEMRVITHRVYSL